MKRESHPMEAKKDLARRIVTDFHSADAAAKAAEDWAKQFQKEQAPESVEQIPVKFADIEWSADGVFRGVRLDRLLVKCGLAESGSEATRKIKEGAVKVNDEVAEGIHILTNGFPEKLFLRVGKRIKVAAIHR
jgi:tyrosyl-tRNA synthetase